MKFRPHVETYDATGLPNGALDHVPSRDRFAVLAQGRLDLAEGQRMGVLVKMTHGDLVVDFTGQYRETANGRGLDSRWVYPLGEGDPQKIAGAVVGLRGVRKVTLASSGLLEIHVQGDLLLVLQALALQLARV